MRQRLTAEELERITTPAQRACHAVGWYVRPGHVQAVLDRVMGRRGLLAEEHPDIPGLYAYAAHATMAGEHPLSATVVAVYAPLNRVPEGRSLRPDRTSE